jgi:hypothetical protein
MRDILGMKNEGIIYELAKEAGANIEKYNPPVLDNMNLEKFAELVIKNNREENSEEFKLLKYLVENEKTNYECNLFAYNMGFYNGLERALSVFENRPGVFKKPNENIPSFNFNPHVGY